MIYVYKDEYISYEKIEDSVPMTKEEVKELMKYQNFYDIETNELIDWRYDDEQIQNL